MEEEIKEESIEYNENDRKFMIKQDKPIKFGKCFTDEIETHVFYNNIIEPSYYYQIKEDKIIIRIELPGEVLNFKSRLNPIRGFYYFNCKGTIKFPKTEELCFKGEKMKDGEFRLDFKIPMNIGTISYFQPMIRFDETNGIVIITYEISKFQEEEDD